MKFKLFQKLKISSLLYNKKFTVILSVVLAFALWLGISMVNNPIRKETFNNLSATISLEGTAAEKLGLGIVSDVSSHRFTITVEGKSSEISKLKSEDFVLSASTLEINSPGNHSLYISPSNKKGNLEYNVISIEPASITVFVDYIDTKEFTVLPKLDGVTPAEGLVAESPIISDSQQSTISIKGPRSTVDKIATVASVAEVNDTLSTSKTFDTDIVLYDANDKILYRYSADGTVYDANENIVTNSYLQLSFTSVKVTQPISKQKTVPCKAVFNNLPDGLDESSVKYTINHSVVTVIGAPEIIDTIEDISLSPIDFRNVTTKSNSFDITATLPNGVKIVDNVENFIVEIDTAKYAEKTFDIKDIRWSGLADGLKASTSSQLKNVKICGPENIIRKIKASDLYALVNLENKTAGEYNVDVVIKSDVYDEIWQVGTYTITIILK